MAEFRLQYLTAYLLLELLLLHLLQLGLLFVVELELYFTGHLDENE